MKICHCHICRGDAVTDGIYYHHQRRERALQHPAEAKPAFQKSRFWPEDGEDYPLYDGSSETVIHTLAQMFALFSDCSGFTKKLLDRYISDYYSSIEDKLKKDNSQANIYFPKNYKSALTVIEPYLTETVTYDSCVYDHTLFRKFDENKDYSNLTHCPDPSDHKEYGSARYFKGTKKPRKTVTYLPIGPRLQKMYGETNIAKLIHAGDVELKDDILKDFGDGDQFRQWFSEGGIFYGNPAGAVALALMWDGVNSNRNLKFPHSFWPIFAMILNFKGPNKNTLGFGTFLISLLGGYDGKEPKSLGNFSFFYTVDSQKEHSWPHS